MPCQGSWIAVVVAYKPDGFATVKVRVEEIGCRRSACHRPPLMHRVASLVPRRRSLTMSLRVQPCRACGRDVVLLPTLARAWWPFEARSFPRDRVAPRDRWVLRRRPFAVVPADDESSARFLARHYCAEYQLARLHASLAVAGVVSSVAAKH